MTSYYEIEQYLAKLITAVAHSERNVHIYSFPQQTCPFNRLKQPGLTLLTTNSFSLSIISATWTKKARAT